MVLKPPPPLAGPPGAIGEKISATVVDDNLSRVVFVEILDLTTQPEDVALGP